METRFPRHSQADADIMSHPQPVCDFTTTQQPMKAGFKTGRRQHRSCDQCRKGKRACDVAFAKEPGKTKDLERCAAPRLHPS